MILHSRTASGRRYCRKCGALAEVTRNLCTGCQSAEVRAHLRAGAQAASQPEAKDVQDAYAASLQSVRARKTTGYATAVMSGTAPLSREHQTLSHAQRFGATLAAVPSDAHAAEVFFAYSRRAFYLHVRSLIRQFDPRKRLATRRRDAAARPRKNKFGNTSSNRALSKALRLTRIFLQMEMIPLALKLDCSQSQVWHLETGKNVVQHKWVERYATAFNVTTDGLYAYAAALQADDQADTKAQLRLFAAHVLGESDKSAEPAALQVANMKTLAGAALHVPRKTASSKRQHPGTGYPMNKAVGQALRYVRMRAQMDVPEFAATAGMSASHIYNMECDRKTVGNHIVNKYAQTFGVRAAHLWTLADEILAIEDPSTIDDTWLSATYEKICNVT